MIFWGEEMVERLYGVLFVFTPQTAMMMKLLCFNEGLIYKTDEGVDF